MQQTQKPVLTNLFPFPYFQESYANSEDNVIFGHFSNYQHSNRFLNSLLSTPMVPFFLFGDDSISNKLDTNPIEKFASLSKSTVYVSHTVDLSPSEQAVRQEPIPGLSSADPTAVDEVHTTPESADEGPDTPNLPLKESTIGNEVSPIVLGYPEKRKRKKKKKYKNKKKNMFILDDLSELNSFNRWLLGLKPNNGGHVPVILKKSKKKTRKKERATMREGIAQSVQKSDKLISESLAIILKNQHHYEEAIVMYEQLILLIPEKSAYFAAQIEEIKKNIH